MGAEHGPTQARETEVRLRRRWARASTTGRHSHPVQHFRVAHRCGSHVAISAKGQGITRSSSMAVGTCLRLRQCNASDLFRLRPD
jgi:hypothetical protein